MSFGRRVIKALPLMLLALVFTFLLSRTGLFAELETTFLDIQMRMDAPDAASDVVIVDIEEADFYADFEGQTSPLNPPKLLKLIETIAEAGPCVIGVDIDTKFGEFGTLNVDKLSNVVWARPHEIRDDFTIVPGDVLGRKDPKNILKSGVPVSWSEKGLKRYYSRLIETTEGNLPSLAWSLFNLAKEGKCPGIKFPELEESTEKMIISFSRGVDGSGGGERTRISAGTLLRAAEKPDWNKELIRGKIIIVGGSYLKADRSETPLGMMNGFQINANVLESDLRGGGVKPPSTLSIVLLQIFDGFLLIALFQVFPVRKAALLTVPIIIALSLACSFLTYYSFAHWAFFAPVMIGVALTAAFDELKDHFKKRYKKEISETYLEFRGPRPDEEQNPVIEK